MDSGRPVPGRQSSLDLAGPVCPALSASPGPEMPDASETAPAPEPAIGSSKPDSHEEIVGSETDAVDETVKEPANLADASTVEDEGGRGKESGEVAKPARPACDDAMPRSGPQTAFPGSPANRPVPTSLADPLPSVPEGMTLDQALASVAEAAREWGVRSHEREGRFVSALMVAIRTLGRASELSRAELRDASRQHLDGAKAERDKARDLARSAEAALEQARSAVIVAEVERDQVVATMVEKTLPLFAKHMREVMVIREQAWNIDRRRRRDALAGLMGIGMFLAGVGVCAWWFAPEVGFANTCRWHSFASQGHVYCNMDALVAARSQ